MSRSPAVACRGHRWDVTAWTRHPLGAREWYCPWLAVVCTEARCCRRALAHRRGSPRGTAACQLGTLDWPKQPERDRRKEGRSGATGGAGSRE
jgi:hypothetical protein